MGSNSALLDLVRSTQDLLRGDHTHAVPARTGVVFSSTPSSYQRTPPTAPGAASPEPPEVDRNLVGIPTCGSFWVNRATGDLVEVVARPAGTGTEAIVFRRASASSGDIPEPTSTLLYGDFVNLHRPWTHNEAAEVDEQPKVFPLPGEEWEHTGDHTEIDIVAIDADREIVHVAERKVKRRRSIPLREFSSGSWRKIVRRTSYEHLMDDEL